jgi:hypothetical protein
LPGLADCWTIHPRKKIIPTLPIKKKDIEKLVREEVSMSLDQIVRTLEEATKFMHNAGGSGFSSKRQMPEGGQTSPLQNRDRTNKRTLNGRLICRTCGKLGYIAQKYPNPQITCDRFQGSWHIARHYTSSNCERESGANLSNRQIDSLDGV